MTEAPLAVRVAVALAPTVVLTAFGLLVSANTMIADLLLLVAVVVASLFGQRLGLLASLVSFLSLAGFFTDPPFLEALHDRNHLIALGTYVVVAMIMGSLVKFATSLRHRVQLHEQEALLRLELKRRLLVGQEPADVVQYATDKLVEIHGLADCRLTAGSVEATSSRDLPAGHAVAFHAGLVKMVVTPSREQPLSSSDYALLKALAAGLAAPLERERLAVEEARAARMNAAVAQSRSTLLSVVGHNLRTPLASVKASVAMLLCPKSLLDQAERRELLETIHEETDRLERFVSKVLALRRLHAGNMRPEPAPVDLAGLAGAVARRLSPLFGDRQLRLAIPELPVLQLDMFMMEQVLLNLLENALRYAPSKSEVRIEARASDGQVEVRVIDHGPGVMPEIRHLIFNEYFQAESRPDGFGTGLGLSIVRGLVEIQKGSAWCEDTPGGGATFVVRLPVVAS